MKRTLRGDRNQCPTCGEYFNSSAAFAKHRIGRHGQDRRCMNTWEMDFAGMAKNSAGWWVSSRRENAFAGDACVTPRDDRQAVGITLATRAENGAAAI